MPLLQVSRRCPHCSELKDFAVTEITELRYREVAEGLPPLWDQMPRGSFAGGTGRKEVRHGLEFCGISRCPHCHNPMMFVFLSAANSLATALGRVSSHPSERLASDSFHVLTTHPAPQNFSSHSSWPEKIRDPFVELQEDVARGRTAGRIIAGCRSILDVATKDLLRKYRADDPDPENPKGGRPKEDIFSRVNALAEIGLLTGALGEWAHKLRKLGADATHDLDGDADDAKQFVEFLKLFLHVAYELPQAIKDQWPEGPALESLASTVEVDATPSSA
jgi:hypothetical protein